MQKTSQETYSELVKSLEVNRDRKLSGLHNSILTPFPNFNKYFPGFERGKYIITTASSGIGKTKITKFLFVINSYKFCKVYNIPLRIYYFALEETKNNFWLSIISTQLFHKYGIEVDSKTLKSVGESILTEDLLIKVKEVEKEVSDMMNYIEVIDNISNPFGIYKYVREKSEIYGKKIGEGFNAIYKPNNPEEYVFIITDHISLLTAEKDPDTGEKMSHWQAINKFSQEYCLKGFCKRWNYITVNIQQQEAAKEKQEYTFKGNSIEDKLEPSLDGLADNKLTQRDCDLVLGLFSPERYNITNFRDYNITKLKGCYRALKVIKDRDFGLDNSYIHLYFNGAINIFKELPSSKVIDYSKYI